MGASEHKWGNAKTVGCYYDGGKKRYQVTQTSFDETTGTGTYNIKYTIKKLTVKLKQVHGKMLQ